MAAPFFEVLEHPADIGFRAYGESLPELFTHAAMAMLSIAGETEAVEPRQEYPLEVSSTDLESLMVDWLSEVLYWYDGRRVAFRDFRVTAFENYRIQAVGLGEPRNPEVHPPKLIVKAVTYHQLRVEKRNGTWVAEVFLDV